MTEDTGFLAASFKELTPEEMVERYNEVVRWNRELVKALAWIGKEASEWCSSTGEDARMTLDEISERVRNLLTDKETPDAK